MKLIRLRIFYQHFAHGLGLAFIGTSYRGNCNLARITGVQVSTSLSPDGKVGSHQ